MDYRYWNIIDTLSETEYKTAQEIGDTLGLSEKTVRTRMRELNEHLMPYQTEVVSKPRYGYCLQIHDQARWMEFKQGRYEADQSVPVDSSERVEYLLAVFLNRKDYIKLEELSEFLYVSTKTLTNELKRVEYILSHFDIRLSRKPYYGLRAEGPEFSKRCCILHNFWLSQKPFWELKRKQEDMAVQIADILLRLTGEYRIKFAEATFQNTVYYIYLAISRMKKGIFITETAENKFPEIAEKENRLAEQLYQELAVPDLNIPQIEIDYTGIYIAGKRIIGNEPGNMFVSERIDHLVSRILEEIYLGYGVDLRYDLNLRIMLIQHLIPMEIRLKFGIPVENVMAEEAREKYVLAYSMAQLAVAVLSEAFGKAASENEISCIAMYFAMALEEKKTLDKKKNNILLVCVSGNASSRMLMYKFQKEFSEYINSLQICSMYEFDQIDLKNIDFIFTTVPICGKITVPVMEIHDFLEGNDIMSVRHFLQVGDMNFLNRYYRKELFFADLPGNTKEEVIDELCRRMAEVTTLPDGFADSVRQRESFGPTDFGNLAAIPHPCRIMTKENLVAIAVLQKEIRWTTHQVQVVILTSLSSENDDEVQKFYDITSEFLSDKHAVRNLIAEPTFANFEKMITVLKR